MPKTMVGNIGWASPMRNCSPRQQLKWRKLQKDWTFFGWDFGKMGRVSRSYSSLGNEVIDRSKYYY